MKTVIQFIHEIGDGGASALVKDYVHYLRNDGYEPVVVVTFPDEKASNYQIIKNSGIEILHLYPRRNLYWRLVNKICPRWYLSHKLWEIISCKKPIAIHAHLAVLQYLAPIRKKLKCKLLYTCHSLPNKCLTNESNETNAARMLLRDNELIIIALHNAMRDEINHFFGIENTRVVTNGIDLSRYQNTIISKEYIRDKLGIPKDAFVLGHVGRFVNVKNHAFLIDVFYEATKINPKCFLLLIGSGPNEEMIRKRLNELNLSDKNMILSHRTDVPELLQAMDAFVLPSKFEGFSLVSIEAQLSGLRYTTTTTTPKEAVVSSNAVILSLEDSAKTWAEKTLNAIPCSEDKLSDFSRYDMANIVKKLERLYEGEECEGKFE